MIVIKPPRASRIVCQKQGRSSSSSSVGQCFDKKLRPCVIALSLGGACRDLGKSASRRAELDMMMISMLVLL